MKPGMSSIAIRSVLSLLCGLHCSAALAGPPLSIDDPGILAAGELEIIFAATMSATDGGNYHDLPLLDLSVGLIEDYVQASIGVSHVYVALDNAISQQDVGNPSVGVKFRFVNTDRLQVAFAPAYVFGVSDSTAQKGVGDSANIAVYPFNAEYQLNDAWRFNGELSYARSDENDKEWGYGVAFARTLNARRELLFEVSGSGGNFLGSDFMQARVGIDSAMSDSFSLLFSIGTGLREPDGEDSTNLDVFIGFKYVR